MVIMNNWNLKVTHPEKPKNVTLYYDPVKDEWVELTPQDCDEIIEEIAQGLQ